MTHAGLRWLTCLAVMGCVICAGIVQAGTVWLSDLDLSRMKVGYGQAQKDLNIVQKPLAIAGEQFEKGVGSHADSILHIHLNGGTSRFTAQVGVDDSAQNKGSVCFRIYGDDKLLFNSGTMKGGQKAKSVKLKTTGIQTLILVVTSAGNGIDYDHADWANAKFDVTGPMPEAIDAPVEEKVILTPRPGPAPKLNNPLVFGTRPGNPFIYRIPATGTRPMTFAVEGLPATLKLDPESGILAGTSPDKRGEYAMVFKAGNASGQDERPFKLVVGDTLALTPPMGWNSWYIHYNRVTDAGMREAADAMVASGMADYGYMYVNIDDCWSKKRREEPYRDNCGGILTNEKFPDMKGLTDYIHSKGLRAGIYTSPGPWTCAGYMSTLGHEQDDAQRFAEWGFDFLKYDWCTYEISDEKALYDYMKPYALMGEILKNLKRDMVYNLCQYGMGNVWEWGAKVEAQTWRTMGDVGFMSFLDAGLQNCQYAAHAGPGRWNDPDYILIGWVGDARKMGEGAPVNLTPNQYYQYMSLWTMMASPLFFSGEMTRLDDFTLNVLCNAEIIGVNQDILGRQGVIVTQTEDYFVITKPLAEGSIAAGVFNTSVVEQSVRVSWKELGLKGRQSVRDLWRQQDLGAHKNSIDVKLPLHGVVMLRLSLAK